MVRINLQTVDVSLPGLLELVLLLEVPSEGQQSLAQVLLGIRVTSVQFQRRFEVHDGLLEGTAVGVKCTTRDKPFNVARIDGQRFVQALERFRVTPFLEVLDSFGDGSEIEKKNLKNKFFKLKFLT